MGRAAGAFGSAFGFLGRGSCLTGEVKVVTCVGYEQDRVEDKEDSRYQGDEVEYVGGRVV